MIREKLRVRERFLGVVGKGINKGDWEEKVKEKKKEKKN